MRAEDQLGLARYRNWVVAGVLVVVVVIVVLVAGRPTSGPRPRVAFGAQVPIQAAELTYNNGWAARVRLRMIGVYAGSQSFNRHNGLLIVVRTASGRQRRKDIVLHGSGAVTLLKPATPKSEDDAFHTTLHFVTANGATGILDLSDDRVALSH